MKKKILAILLSLMFITTLGIATAYEIGENVKDKYPFLTDEYKIPFVQVPLDVRKTQISMGETVMSLEPPDNETCIYKVILLDLDYEVMVEFTDDDQWGYVNEGDTLEWFVVHVNISKSYANSTAEAVNYTRVWMDFTKSPGGSLTSGYLFPFDATDEGTHFEVTHYGYFEYEFEAGLYLVYNAYDAYL